MMWRKPNKVYSSSVFILPPFEANALEGDTFSFTIYPYNKITMKTIDKTNKKKKKRLNQVTLVKVKYSNNSYKTMGSITLSFSSATVIVWKPGNLL